MFLMLPSSVELSKKIVALSNGGMLTELLFIDCSCADTD